MKENGFDKSQHLCSKKRIDTLFAAKTSFVVYPIRVIYHLEPSQADLTAVQLLLSVSKRHFKRAVKRNRVKRQLREAYRNNSSALRRLVAEQSLHLDIAFLWLADELYSSELVNEKICEAITVLTNKINDISVKVEEA